MGFLDLTRSWRFSQFCWRCDTSKKPGDPYSFWDLSEDPEWEQTHVTHGQFLARMIRAETASPLLLLPNFHFGIIKHCSLHNLNLGIMGTCNGGAMLLLCDLCFFGCSETLTLRQRLATAYRDFRQWCSENKVQCGQPLFREGMVWNQSYGAYFTAKGYNNRCILAWLSDCLAIAVKKEVPINRYVGAWIQSEVANHSMDWPHHEMLEPSACCLDSLNRMFLAMESSGRYLTESEADAIYSHGMTFLRTHRILTALSQRNDLLFWISRPKIHMVHHQLRDCKRRRYNIRFEHTFIDEDQMKWAKRICQLSDRRNLANSIAKKAPIRLLAMKSHMKRLNSVNKQRIMK